MTLPSPKFHKSKETPGFNYLDSCKIERLGPKFTMTLQNTKVSNSNAPEGPAANENRRNDSPGVAKHCVDLQRASRQYCPRTAAEA